MKIANLATGIALSALAIFVLYRSALLLHATYEQGRPWFESSGITSALAAGALLFCAVRLCFSVSSADVRLALSNLRKLATLEKWRGHLRALAVFVWLGIYIFLLIPLLPYFISTALFIFCPALVFSRNFFKSLSVALISSYVVGFVFSEIVRIPLP